MTPASAGNLGLGNKKIGMMIFLASEVMFFTGLLGAYVVLRNTAPNWPAVSGVLNFRLGFLNTGILIFSSFVFALSRTWANSGKILNARLGQISVLILGLTFLEIQFLEYRSLWIGQNIRLSGHLFGAWFYILTALHGLHLLAGIFCLAYSLLAKKAHQGSESFSSLGLYWNFMTAVWAVLFFILYVIG